MKTIYVLPALCRLFNSASSYRNHGYKSHVNFDRLYINTTDNNMPGKHFLIMLHILSKQPSGILSAACLVLSCLTYLVSLKPIKL